jgi:hypothetical protein
MYSSGFSHLKCLTALMEHDSMALYTYNMNL